MKHVNYDKYYDIASVSIPYMNQFKIFIQSNIQPV
jgi:hypothetical protein